MTAMTAAGGTNESEMTTYNDFDNEKNIINAFRREQLQAAHPPGDKTYEAERKGRTRIRRPAQRIATRKIVRGRLFPP